MTQVVPQEIKYHRNARQLELCYSDADVCQLSAEYLRVYSPSAEVQGHGEGEETLQVGKKNVSITGIEPVGNYGLKLIFDDGHNTGIYTWSYFRELCENEETWWQDYLSQLQQAGASRDPDESVVKIML